MKKLVFVTVIILVMVSCKKSDYSCTCKQGVDIVESKIKNAILKEANKKCYESSSVPFVGDYECKVSIFKSSF